MASAVEYRDIASGRIVLKVTGPFNILTDGPASTNGKYCRAIVALGAVTVKGIDGVNEDLDDLGNFQWNVQFSQIVTGSAYVIW